MLAKFGTTEQRTRWLPDLASGKRRSGIALIEPQAGSDLQGIATVARLAGDHYVVNGSKTRSFPTVKPGVSRGSPTLVMPTRCPYSHLAIPSLSSRPHPPPGLRY